MESKILKILRAACLLFLLVGIRPALFAQTELNFSGDLITTTAFMADLASLYEARGKGTINLTLVTSTDAIKRAATGEVDFGGSARTSRMNDRQERRVAVYPIVWDALVVIVHPSSPLVNMSLSELRQVYLGEIADWSDLGGGAAPIELYVHEDSLNGVDFNLAELLMGDSSTPLARTRDFSTTEELQKAVEAEPNAMAVTSYSSARDLQVKILALEGRSAALSTIQAGDYVLYIPLYLAVREDGRNRRQVRDFLRFASGTEAKRLLRRNGVVPYTDGMALASKQLERAQLLERIRNE